MIVYDCTWLYIYIYICMIINYMYMIIYHFTDSKMGESRKICGLKQQPQAILGVRWGWVRKKSKTLRAHLIRLTSRLGRSHHQWPCSAQVIYPVWHLKLWTPMDSGLRLRTAHNRRLWLYEPSPSYIRTAPSETQLGKVHHCRLSDVPNCPAAQLQSCSAQRLFRQQLPPIKASGKRPHIFHTLC